MIGILRWIGIFFAVLFVIRLYKKWKMKWNGSYTCLVGKTAIVTGSNTGLGYGTALDFAMRGARVILACRNADKAEAAKRKIIQSTGNENVVVKIVDMSSLKSIRKFAADVEVSEDRLDILVNNAGVSVVKDLFTKDGLQTAMQTNHLSVFLLTHLLLGKLKKSAPSRIVTVSSWMAAYGRFVPEKINMMPKIATSFVHAVVYSNTKLCNLVFTTMLAEKLKGTGVTANVVEPGTIMTQIYDDTPFFIYYSTCVLRIILRTVEEGIQSIIYAAVSKDIEGVNGKFYSNCEETRYYANARGETFAREIWEKSEELVKLADHEKI